ncbi:MAG: cell surface protein SprA [Bacteroidia bacterium]
MSKFSIAWLVSAFLALFYPDPSPDHQDQEVHPVRTAIEVDSLLPPVPLIIEEDTSKKRNPNDRRGDATHQPYVTPLYLGNPGNMRTIFELDSTRWGYSIYERVGDIDVRDPSYIPFDSYIDYRRERGVRDYFREQSLATNAGNSKGLQLDINIEELSDIFGGGTVSIRPTGYATLDFSLDRNRTDNPAQPQRLQRVTAFNFDQQIQLGVIGQIGEKLKLNANFDTQATFDFENELKLAHSGTEDQILQNIEAGNVSMQVGNSLIQGRQNLFGVKTRLKFGPVYVSGIASIERGKVESINVSGGGAIETPFEKEVSEYDMNRHFFLSHYFRSRYEDALSNLPVMQSTLRVNRVEVWVEQQGSTRNNRNAVGFIDLGENDLPIAQGQGRLLNDNLTRNTTNAYRYPDNLSNNLYDLLKADPNTRELSSAKSAIEALPGLRLANTEDFQVLGNMRRLEPNEYSVNSQLGYISINSPIPTDQVLFVAFNYTLNGQNHQVGEFSDDVPANGLNSNVLFLKMLKPSVLRVSPYPAWDLMMKNIYTIGYGLNPDGFFLDIKYESGTSAGKINFLPTSAVANRPLIQVTGLDRVTNNTAPGPDNYFDYVEGVTIVSDRGLVIFPVLEPFGDYLASKLENNPDEVAKYVFTALYDDTQQGAVQRFPELNRFSMEGYYRSSSNAEIPLNTFNLQEGSVTVRAGGRILVEGQDYQVDYFGGKITIINPAILTSGQDINVSFESSSLYGIQTKTLLGSRVEYSPSQNLQLGATILNLREQPFNQKTILGDEPINNTLWGFDASFQDQSDFITKLIDRLPLISTKQTSNVNASIEVAQFLPGAPSVVKNEEEKGIVFLDDFEAAATPFTLQGQLRWKLAAFPEGNDRLYNPANASTDPLAQGATRAKLAWYQIDPNFFRRLNGIEIPQEDQFNNYTRQILPTELFPTASRAFGDNIQFTFDLHYMPAQRGPYNFQMDPARLDPNTGNFTRPEDNWAGITREIDVNNDFEATNVEFLEFWMMDPFMDNPNAEGGEFYINLGLVNEDALPDEGLSQENGLPGANDPGNLRDSDWGRIPVGNPVSDFFANTEADRLAQDVGLDGLSSTEEAIFFQRVLDSLQKILSPAAFQRLAQDPSSDDFRHFRDSVFEANSSGVLDRYIDFNGVENNSPVGDDARRGYSIQGSNQPDTEDLNNNGSLNFAEQYWEYRIRLHPDSLERGQNFVVDKITTDSVPAGRNFQTVTWYQFRIPIKAGRPVNNISNFKTISYMRMYMTGFSEEVVMRMTEFQLVSTQWLRYTGNLADEGAVINPQEPPFAEFELGSVSIEENSQRLPFNYVLPPNVVRQNLNGNTALGFLDDERSLTLKVCGLEDGDARAIFKNTKQDLRQYSRLKMWVHAEPTESGITPSNFYQRGDARVFIRLGLDNDQNYYEYELPLTPSNPGLGVGVPENVWLDDNEFDFELALLALAKEDRNGAGTGLIYRHAFRDSTMPAGHMIYVKGTPKLSDVRNIVIGVRNPSDPDAQPICMEVWVNELRLTNFDKQTGWAANASLALQLADIGQINATGAFRTAGFGPLEQKLSTRSLEDMNRFDVAANLSIDRFFPKKWGLQLPVYATYGEQRINPQFNPQEADVRTDILIENLPEEQATQVLERIQDFQRRRSISFNNWRIDPQKEKAQAAPQPPGPRPGGGMPQGGQAKFDKYPWSVSNFDFTYSYNEQYARNAVIEKRFNTQHRGAINYRYQFPQVQVKPFQSLTKLKFIEQRAKFLTNFAFSPFPSMVSVALTGDRQFEERLMRPTSQFGGAVDPLYAKNFLLNRNYNLSWNLTRSLQVTFSANNVARVDEVQGYWETATQRERDSIGRLGENLLHLGRDTARGHDQLINFGRTTTYTHNVNVAYQLPFQQIKPLNWINGTVNYTGSFNWQQAPEINPSLGGTIGNSQNIQANGRLDMKGLYRKFKPLAKILDAKSQTQRPGQAPQKPQPETPRRNQDLSQAAEAETDSTAKPDPFRFLKLVGKEVLRIALSIQSIDVQYSQSNSTILPGYVPRTDNFGMDWGFVDTITRSISPIVPPTLGFILGSQRDIRNLAGQNNWITRDTTLANLFMRNSTQNLTARTSVELFKGFRIDLSANRSVNFNESEFFRWDPVQESYRSFDPLSNGNFTMSYIFIGTAFENVTPKQPGSRSFDEFSRVRQDLSRRYADQNPATKNDPTIVEGGYRNGYLGSNQDVLISSMLAAYGIVGSDRIELSAFPRFPLPNWSINYNGLSNIAFFKKYFTSISIKHSYRGTYTVGNYYNNLNFVDMDMDGYADLPSIVQVDPVTGIEIQDYYATNNIQAVQITEQFAPLLGINLTLKNGGTGQIDYKRGRQMTLNVGSLQLVEMLNQDIAVMMGYRKDKLNLTLHLFGKDIFLKNSANFQLRFTLRDTKELNRTLSPTGTITSLAPQFTRGSRNLILSPSIDYVVNTRLNIKLFFERNVNTPYTSNAFNTAFTSGGVQVRFTLAN